MITEKGGADRQICRHRQTDRQTHYFSFFTWDFCQRAVETRAAWPDWVAELSSWKVCVLLAVKDTLIITAKLQAKQIQQSQGSNSLTQSGHSLTTSSSSTFSRFSLASRLCCPFSIEFPLYLLWAVWCCKLSSRERECMYVCVVLHAKSTYFLVTIPLICYLDLKAEINSVNFARCLAGDFQGAQNSPLTLLQNNTNF